VEYSNTICQALPAAAASAAVAASNRTNEVIDPDCDILLARGAPPLEDGLVAVPLDMRATRDVRGPPLANTGWLLPAPNTAAPGTPGRQGLMDSARHVIGCRLTR